MKHMIAIALATFLIPMASAQAATCLATTQIKSTDAPDGKALLIKMKSGDVWRADFQRTCSGIRYSGFSWVVDSGRICENAQTLKVLDTGATCTIGKLTQLSVAPAVGK